MSRPARASAKRSVVLVVALAMAVALIEIAFPRSAFAAAPAFVQANAREVNSGTVASSAFPAANTAGNLIVAFVIWGNSGSVMLSDSRGNTYASARAATAWGNGDWMRAQVFYAKNVAAGANTVSATFASSLSGSFGLIYIHEYSGIDRVNPLDVSAAAKGTGSALNSGSVTTTNARDLLFAAAASAGTVTSVGAGYTTRSTYAGNRTADRNVTTAGAYNATATHSGGPWAMQLVAFKADAGPDTTPPTAAMTAPASGSTVSGTITVSADARDDVAVADVDFLLDGVSMGIDTTAPYSTQWETTTTSNGPHNLSARARDTSGNFGVTSGVVTVTVNNPTTPALPAGLVGAWNFNESTGSTSADVTGNGNTARLVNGPLWTAGRYGGGLRLDGVDDYLVVDNSPTLDISGTAMSFSAWVNPLDGGGDEVLFGKFYNGTMSSPFYQYGVELQGGITPVFIVGTSGGERYASMGSGLAVGQWSHLAVVFTGSSAQFYVNGNLVSTQPISATITQRNTPIQVGADITPNQYFTGTVDDVRLYNRTLTQAEVQSDLNTPLLSPATDPTAPSVSVVSPADNAQISGIVTVTADATDDVGVLGVQFFVDGVPTGAEDTATPYTVNWDSRGYTNGVHTINARARDTAGNVTTSNPVTVNVANSDFFQNEVLATGLELPTAMKFLPDGRLLVAELQGRIKVLPPPYTTPDPALFLQIPVGQWGVYQGILDLALDPDFATNHYYYVFYTSTGSHDRLSRFTANAALTGTVAGSERILYEDPAIADIDHHGAGITFGNDGKLMFTTGDNIDAQASQDLTNPRGKVHRINRDGTVPSDNPFYDGAGPHWDSVWAYGLRNPFRTYYDSPTGRLFIGDVGGNVGTSNEEVNLGVRGANYGWPNYEGACPAPCTSPIYDYEHNNRDAAVTGGFVYHGSQFPTLMQGNYFFADYAQNWIKRMTLDAAGNVTGVFNFEPIDGQTDGPYGDIVYLTEGPDGALYYLDIGYSDTSGTFGVSKVRRIRYLQSNRAPIAVASASPTSGPQPLTVNFSSAGSSDPEGQPITYSWDFGDGSAVSTAANPSHTYTAAGAYTVRLTVSDGVNSTFSPPVNISVGSAPVATITAPLDGATFRAGDTIAFSGDATDADDGTLPASAFTWTIDFLHEGHVHPDRTVSGVRSGSFTIPTSGHDFSGNTRYRIALTVTDSNGLRDTKSVVVWPEKVDLTFNSTPTNGLTLYLDGIAKTTPFTYDTLIGFSHTVEARDQDSGNLTYTFSSWSDGGAQTHTLVVPATDHSYTAAYTATAANGPVAAWGFNEPSGTTSADATAHGNTATLVNGLARVAGRYGNGLSFDGLDDYLTVPNSGSIDVSGNALTLSMWLKPTGGGPDEVLLGKHWNATMTSPYYQYGLELQFGGTVPVFIIGTTGGALSVSMGSSLSTSQWSHLAVVFNGTAVQFYVDGALVTTQALTATITARGQHLRMGADADTNQFYRGLLDDVRIYNRVQTAVEVRADMNSAL